eukprot:TRINITY_DN6375_c0_g1_i1.p1 TRINITY_DN6375_c0_g1~~TRINITY_DN6375_c0_g1_i1.p1  ORF type:complete len:295 (+),score=97.48 TRINITY_DN6375_c0_g1_i1:124-1008(+)
MLELMGLVFVIFITPLIVGFLHDKVRNSMGKGQQTLLSYLNVISAALFLSLSFFHILSESFGHLEDLFPEVENELRLRYLFAAYLTGWLVMLWLDKVLVGGHGHSHSHSAKSTLLSLSEPSTPESGTGGYLYATLGGYLGLCIHSLLAGVALGTSSKSESFPVTTILVLFPLHKAMDALVVATQLARHTKFMYSLFMFIFACVTPLGMLIGLGVLHPDSTLFNYAGLLEGASGGIFLYISTSHILAEELDAKSSGKLVKVGLFTLTLAATFILGSLDLGGHVHFEGGGAESIQH